MGIAGSKATGGTRARTGAIVLAMIAAGGCGGKGGGGDGDAVDTAPDVGDADTSVDTVDAPDVPFDEDGAVPDAGDADADADASGDAPDSTDVVEEEAPPFTACTPFSGAVDRIVLRGTVLTPDVEIPDGEVLVLGDTGDAEANHIACVGAAGECDVHPASSGATVVCTDGVILPGMIDAHNHIHYNILPPWRHAPTLYEDRYEWAGTAAYSAFKDPYDAVSGDHLCQIVKWSEARIVIGGGTSVQGCSGSRCIMPLVRNLEWSIETSGLGESNLRTRVTPIADMEPTTAANLVIELDSGATECFIPHIAEGVNESSRAEFDTLATLGLMREETTVIHGTAATTDELAAMAAAGMRLVWSPSSNCDLYGLTTRVTVARSLGIPIALAPDWTPSGRMSLIEELECADELNRTYYDSVFTDEELVRMVTSVPAEAVHLEDKIGRLEPGLYADVTVIAGDRHHPWRAVVAAGVRDVLLVIRDGKLLYGEAGAAAPIAGPFCETMDLCGTPRSICVKLSDDPTDGFDETLVDIRTTLETALMDGRILDPDWNPSDTGATYEWELYDLFSCDPPPSCRFGTGSIPGTPATGDADGDGVPDSSDDCPLVFDPDQSDTDSDSQGGDACDPCPLDPGSTTCAGSAPGDVDGDGEPDVTDNCRLVPNPLQADTDADGKGDACDPCPSIPNPGTAACPVTVTDIQGGLVPELDPVHVSGVVVTAVRSAGASNSIWVQEPAGGPWSGIRVFLGAVPPTVIVGDVVDVDGTYEEFYGLSEITSPTVTFVGSGAAPVPETIADPSTIATGGSMAEAYESVLVEVGPVAVTDANPDTPSDYGEFAVTGGLRVDDFLFSIAPDPILGQPFASLAGVLDYGFSKFKLLPRSAADVVGP